jgi:hypothetical protein
MEISSNFLYVRVMNNYASAIDCEMLGLLDQRKDGRKQKETKIMWSFGRTNFE